VATKQETFFIYSVYSISWLQKQIDNNIVSARNLIIYILLILLFLKN